MTFAAGVTIVFIWALSGPIFHFSDTWQLVINTGTTVITFLMVFLIQHTQNQDSAAAQLKLDEIIRAVGGARNVLLDMEEMDQEELERIRDEYEKLARRARAGDRRRESRSTQNGTAFAATRQGRRPRSNTGRKPR